MADRHTRAVGHSGAGAVAILIALLAAAVVGAAVASRPVETLAAVGFAAAAAALLAICPTRGLIAIGIAAVGVIPIIMSESASHSISLRLTPFQGQARFVAFLLVVAVMYVIVRRHHVALNRLTLGLLLAYAGGLAVEVLVSYVRGTEYSGLFGDFARQTLYACAFFVAAIAGANASSPPLRARIYDILGVIIVLFSLSSLVYWGWSTKRFTSLGPVARVFQDALAGTGSQFGEGRSIFPFVDQSPNASAVSFALLACFVVPPLAIARSNWRRLLACAVVLGAGAAVLATQSREGVIAAVAGFAPLLLVARRLPRRMLAGAVVAAVAIVLGAAALFPAERGLSLRTATMRARETIWSQALHRFDEAPLLGHGFNVSSRPAFTERLPNTVHDVGAPMARLVPIHNQYLGRLFDGGAIGAAIFVAVMIGLFIVAKRRLADGRMRVEAVALLAVLAVLVVSMLASSTLDTAGVAITFWLIVGWTAGTRDRPAV